MWGRPLACRLRCLWLRKGIENFVRSQRHRNRQARGLPHIMRIADCAAGLLIVRGGLWHHVLVDAQTYATNHTPTIGCRTLDVLHVAAAKLIGTTEFCTFDTRQFTLVGQIGLVAVTP